MMSNKGFVAFITFWLLVMLFNIAVWAGGIWIVIHFVGKWW